jgi:hypothetical protein
MTSSIRSQQMRRLKRTSLRSISLFWICCLVLLLVVPLLAQQELNNSSIIEMVKAGLSEKLIIKTVQDSAGTYQLKPGDLISLKKQGVSNAILEAMSEKKSDSSSPIVEPNSTFSKEDALGSLEIWHIQSKADVMTQTTGIVAFTDLPAHRRGNTLFHVEAECTSNILVFEITARESQLLLQRRNGRVDAFGNIIPPKPYVSMRTNVDGRMKLAESDITVPTTATVFFARQTMKQGMDLLGSVGSDNDRNRPIQVPSDAQISENVKTGIKALMDLGIAAQAIGTLEEAYGAKSIKIEVPLANCSAHVLEFHPQSLSFKDFARHCDVPSTLPPSPPRTYATKGSDGFVFLTAEKREFSGTAQEFVQAFPTLLQRAMSASNLGSANFSRETEIIQSAVRTCAEITPEKARSVTNQFGLEVLRRLGDEYRVCEGGSTWVTRDIRHAFDPEKERGLIFTIGDTYQKGAQPWDQGFHISVKFTQSHTDEPPSPDAYFILLARIKRSPSGEGRSGP